MAYDFACLLIVGDGTGPKLGFPLPVAPALTPTGIIMFLKSLKYQTKHMITKLGAIPTLDIVSSRDIISYE